MSSLFSTTYNQFWSFLIIFYLFQFYYYFIWHKIGPFTGLLIPGSIIFVMNVLIVLRLNKIHEESSKLSESTTFNRRAARSSTHMLIAISVTYIILLTPYRYFTLYAESTTILLTHTW